MQASISISIGRNGKSGAARNKIRVGYAEVGREVELPRFRPACAEHMGKFCRAMKLPVDVFLLIYKQGASR